VKASASKDRPRLRRLTGKINMHEIAIIGASGFGKEVAYHINSINKIKQTYQIVGFIDDNADLLGSEIIYGLKVIGNVDDLTSGRLKTSNLCIAIANNPVRLAVYDRLKDLDFVFPNIIHADKQYDESITFGFGNIIGEEVTFTCAINMGSFNIFTGTCGTGHDVDMGDFNLFGPRSLIAGGVKMGDGNTFHMQSAVIQNLKIGNWNTLNLYSCLFKSIKDGNVYFGVPAMKQRF